MEIGQLFYIQYIPNDVILKIYSQLIQTKTITQSQKEDITNSVSLLDVITQYITHNYVFINSERRLFLYLYNQLLLYLKCKNKYNVDEVLSKFKILHDLYKNFVFYIDLKKNSSNEYDLKRKVFNVWFKKLLDKDRVIITTFITQKSI